MTMRPYLMRVLITLSFLLNVLLGGPLNQSFSAAQYQRKKDGKLNLVWIIDKIFYKNVSHCLESWVNYKIISTAFEKRNK
jgi:hypothetical protein